MLQRKLFKTRLCVLYQKGRCSRPTCSFAHGDAELRRSFRPRDGGRDYRFGDLRDNLDRRPSPQKSYSPVRDRNRRKFHGLSPSRSLQKKSDRKHRQKQHIDRPREDSESPNISDGIEDRLKEVKLDINKLENRKLQLEIYETEKGQEADVLSSRIKELEAQLQKQKEECKRVASKIKKFVKAHDRHSRIQDELRRSQARIQKLGHQLGSDATKVSGSEEDLSINFMNDGERTIYHPVYPRNDKPTASSPHKRKLCVDRDTAGESEPEVNLIEDGGQQTESFHLKKVSRWNNQHPINHGPVADGKKLKGENFSTSCSSADKVKNVGSANVFPLSCIAAHALDEEVEVEVENIEDVEIAPTGTGKGATNVAKGLPFKLTPPPVARNAI